MPWNNGLENVIIVLAIFSRARPMSTVVLHKLPEPLHQALKQRAAEHGHSTEDEIQIILETVLSKNRGIGSELAAIGRSLGGVELVINRDPSPTAPASFE